MIKPTGIIEIKQFQLTIKFNNGEIRRLDMETYLGKQNQHVIKEKIMNADFFKQVKIGELGQILWQDAAWMEDENGNTILCEFDISPEFVYYNSRSVKV
ncbi:MAG: DUF2442 domain-containing protein [Bacteroidetes bacterium]|nr:DUF2442 domain-containing protein [Bacteroidota bacterium]